MARWFKRWWRETFSRPLTLVVFDRDGTTKTAVLAEGDTLSVLDTRGVMMTAEYVSQYGQTVHLRFRWEEDA